MHTHRNPPFYRSGVTLIEVLVVLVILALLATVVMASMNRYRAQQTLNASVEVVVSAFSSAHLDSISSLRNDSYGVSIKSDEVIYFRGAMYPGDSDPGNVHFVLPTTIEIADINLAGGGSLVYYKRLSGGTDNFGTFVLRVKSDVGTAKTITINATGAVSL